MKWVIFKKQLLALVLAAAAIFTPIKSMLVVTFVLIGIDFLTGIIAAKKRGESFNSADAGRTVVKFCVYQVAIITGFLLEKYLMDGILPVANLVAGSCGVVEFTSIVENLSSINGKPILQDVIDKLKSKNGNNNNQP